MSTEPNIAKREDEAPAELTRNERYYRPGVDIVERQDDLVVYVDLPGVKPGDIDIQFEDGNLEITGTVRPRQAEGIKYLLQEYGVGSFHRCFQVSEAIDVSMVSAESSHGVLTVRLPKVEAVKPRKIDVKPS